MSVSHLRKVESLHDLQEGIISAPEGALEGVIVHRIFDESGDIVASESTINGEFAVVEDMTDHSLVVEFEPDPEGATSALLRRPVIVGDHTVLNGLVFTASSALRSS